MIPYRYRRCAGMTFCIAVAIICAGTVRASYGDTVKPEEGVVLVEIGPLQCALAPSVAERYKRARSEGEKTRAEVRAETRAWIDSGMETLHRRRHRPDPMSKQYQEAYAKYLALKQDRVFFAQICKELQD
ncbi:hypothetical protein [Achromobacter aloeverae]